MSEDIDNDEDFFTIRKFAKYRAEIEQIIRSKSEKYPTKTQFIRVAIVELLKKEGVNL